MDNKDLGRPGLRPSGAQATPEAPICVGSSPSVSPPNAEDVAEGAAKCLRPELFEPFVRKAADDFYERLLDTVQDYLTDNAEFNIGTRISAAEDRAHNLSIRVVNLEALLSLLVRAVDAGDPNLWHALQRARDAVPNADGFREIETEDQP